MISNLTYLIPLIQLGLGLCLLVWSADLLVRVAQTCAVSWGISPAVVGAIILGCGTSLPELAVSVGAAFNHTPAIAYGNAVGSNLANSALVLGTAAALSTSPILFTGRALRDQLLLNGAATLLFIVLVMFRPLGTWQACVFFVAFVFCLTVMLKDEAGKVSSAIQPKMQARIWRLTLNFLFGLGCIVVASALTVEGARATAGLLGVPQQIVALSIVAFGTSLPELVVTIRLALKGESALIIGNLLGSNIFNLLLVLPVAHFFVPLYLSSADVLRDGGALALITVLVLVFCFSWRGQRRFGRPGGLLFLLIYAGYIAYLAYSGFYT